MVAGVCPAYLPNIQYMAWVVSQKEIAFVTHHPYQKQTFRNRTEIYGANGKLKLTVPIVHKKIAQHQSDNAVAIHYGSSWQKDHWKSLESSYRSSPFFEFFEDDFYPFFHKKYQRLMELNIILIKKILSLIDAEVKILSEKKATKENSTLIIAKSNTIIETPQYQQVFHAKHGFINNLSTLDLLFNLGPQSLEYLKGMGN